MVGIIKWIAAFSLYFSNRKYKYWFRETTDEWVFEVTVEIPGEYCNTSRYVSRLKYTCHVVWFWYFIDVIRDLKRIIKVKFLW